MATIYGFSAFSTLPTTIAGAFRLAARRGDTKRLASRVLARAIEREQTTKRAEVTFTPLDRAWFRGPHTDGAL